MANNIIIALDCGKANTKVAISNKDNSEVILKSYETKVKEVNFDKETDAKIDTIIIDKRKFEIGTPDVISNVDSNSKLDDIHKTMALFAIAQNVNDKDNVLVVGDQTSICISAKDIPSLGKASLGNIMIKGNNVMSVTKI